MQIDYRDRRPNKAGPTHQKINLYNHMISLGVFIRHCTVMTMDGIEDEFAF